MCDRLAITGSRWSVAGAEALLVLCALISNGDFDEYRTFRSAAECRRLYPGPRQHECRLPA